MTMKKKTIAAFLCAAILLSSTSLTVGAAAYEGEPSAKETAALDLAYGASTLAAPTASKESGTITCSKDYAKIKLSAEKGTIYYSLNGAKYKKYTSSIKLTKNSTIEAYAQSGSAKSETVKFTYKLKPEVTANVTYAYWGRNVTLASKVSGVKLYYTADGSKPTTSSEQYDKYGYGDEIQLSKTTKLRVLAVKSGWANASLTENVTITEADITFQEPDDSYFRYWGRSGKLTYTSGLSEKIAFRGEVNGMPVKTVNVHGDYSNVDRIKSITIPDSVTYLDDGALSGCPAITSLVLPDSLTSIGAKTFMGCSSLKSINIPDGVTKIGASAFRNCSALKSITLPSGVTSIEDSTFEGCTSLKSVNIPSGVTYIGYYAFLGCESLKSVTLPDSVSYLGWSVFDGCNCTVTYKGKKYTSKDNYEALYDVFNEY